MATNLKARSQERTTNQQGGLSRTQALGLEVEGFKKWLESIPREILECGSTYVENLSHKELVAKLMFVAKNEPQAAGCPLLAQVSGSERKRPPEAGEEPQGSARRVV